MTLTQQNRPVEGVLGSPPGCLWVIFVIFDVSQGSWGCLGVLLGPRRQGERAEGLGGPRVVPGLFWRGPWKPQISFFLLEVYCQRSNEILMFLFGVVL